MKPDPPVTKRRMANLQVVGASRPDARGEEEAMSFADITVPVMSVTVIKYSRPMGRWQPDARGRLEKAAMELYVERGFDETTVAEIAKRAGLTERTFFRHFADKREVLFAGAAMLQDLFVECGGGRPRRTAARRRSDDRGRGRRRAHTGTPGLCPPALRDHCGERRAAGARAHQARLALGGAGRRARAGAASRTTRPAWRPRWRSPSSGSPSSAGSATPSISTCPSSWASRSTNSAR